MNTTTCFIYIETIKGCDMLICFPPIALHHTAC